MDRLLNRLVVLNKHLRYRGTTSCAKLLAVSNNQLVSVLKRDKHFNPHLANWASPSSHQRHDHHNEFDQPSLNLNPSFKSDRNFSSSYNLNYGRRYTSNSNNQASYSSTRYAKRQPDRQPGNLPRSSGQAPSKGLLLSDIKPIPVKPNMTQDDGTSVGKELTGELSQSA